MKKPLWRGVFCHLFFDKGYYYNDYCTNKPLAMSDWVKSGHDIKDWYITDEWRKSDIAKAWYHGYDLLNGQIEYIFHITNKAKTILSDTLLNEIFTKTNVSFDYSGKKPMYLDSANSIEFIIKAAFLAKQVDKRKHILRFTII